jgi:hypothetical protein
MQEITVNGAISSITDVLLENANLFKSAWFRGQPDYNFSLLPSVFRQGNISALCTMNKRCLMNSNDAIQTNQPIIKQHMNG